MFTHGKIIPMHFTSDCKSVLRDSVNITQKCQHSGPQLFCMCEHKQILLIFTLRSHFHICMKHLFKIFLNFPFSRKKPEDIRTILTSGQVRQPCNNCVPSSILHFTFTVELLYCENTLHFMWKSVSLHFRYFYSHSHNYIVLFFHTYSHKIRQ